MVRKSDKWNYHIDRGTKIIHDNLISILKEKENKMCDVPRLISLLDSRTKKCNFKERGRRKKISDFINDYYTSLINFADTFLIYNVIYKESRVFISLSTDNDINMNDYNLKRDTTLFIDWEFIETPSVINI